MQFQVPQFIETEDRIVGPLTLRQFLYLCAAGGLSFLIYFLVETWLWVGLTLPLVSVAAAFAFVKVNSQPFVRVFGSALKFYWQPQSYVWQPENPELPKNESTMRSIVGEGFSLEKILSGFALKSARQNVQTGTKEQPIPTLFKKEERFQIYETIAGARKAARRIDYR